MSIDFTFWVPVAFIGCLLVIIYNVVRGIPKPEDARFRLYARCRFLAVVLGTVTVIHSFVFQVFAIPSSSMEPTYVAGDYIAVNRSSYHWQLPITHTPLLTFRDPGPGDVVVFRFPSDPSKTYIKRIVGLPGQTVSIQRGRVAIDGVRVPTERVSAFHFLGDTWVTAAAESLGDVQYFVRHSGIIDPENNKPILDGRSDGSWDVPADHYFVLGDNRENSNDSRFIGMIPKENILGEVADGVMHWPQKTELPEFSWVPARQQPGANAKQSHQNQQHHSG
jgi:signal peptidase I